MLATRRSATTICQAWRWRPLWPNICISYRPVIHTDSSSFPEPLARSLGFGAIKIRSPESNMGSCSSTWETRGNLLTRRVGGAMLKSTGQLSTSSSIQALTIKCVNLIPTGMTSASTVHPASIFRWDVFLARRMENLLSTTRRRTIWTLSGRNTLPIHSPGAFRFCTFSTITGVTSI